MSAAQSTGADTPDAQEYAGELGGFVLARSTLDRVSARRGDTDWLAAAWADPGTRVLVLDNARALVRFGDKEAELILVPTAEAPEGLRFLLGVDDAEVAYFGVMGPPGCLESLTEDAEAPGQEGTEQEGTEQEAGEQEAGEQEAAAPEAAGEERSGPGGCRAGSRRGRKPRQEAAGQEAAEQEAPEQEAPAQEAPAQEAPPEAPGRKRPGRKRLGRRLRRQRPSSRR